MDRRELPLNAVSRLTVRGLATDSEQSPVLLDTFPGKRTPGIIYHDQDDDYNDPAPPLIPPCELPDPGDLHLDLALRDKISVGAVGAVYSCDVDLECTAAVSHHIPPLVIKIAAPATARHASLEAWFYKEMESLQGAIIPRCYGFFVVQVPDTYQIPAWKDIEEPFKQREFGRNGEYPLAEEVVDEQDFDCGRRLVSILVLEQLGPKLPRHPITPITQATREEIWNMFRELADLGIIHWDLRYENILSSSSQGALPGLASPLKRKFYRWRIIDFDRAARTRMIASETHLCYDMRGLKQFRTFGTFPDTSTMGCDC